MKKFNDKWPEETKEVIRRFRLEQFVKRFETPSIVTDEPNRIVFNVKGEIHEAELHSYQDRIQHRLVSGGQDAYPVYLGVPR